MRSGFQAKQQPGGPQSLIHPPAAGFGEQSGVIDFPADLLWCLGRRMEQSKFMTLFVAYLSQVM
jgi:hypothetical protein